MKGCGLFGRKKKNSEDHAGIGGLPAVTVSVVDSPQNPTSSTPPPGSSTTPPEGTVAPVTARTTMRIDGGAAVIDARNVPGLRLELLDVISHGSNPAEIQDIVLKAMSEAQAFTAGMPPLTGGAITPISPPAEDPLDRLKKLNDLRVSGALTDAEFEAQKAKILGET
jgi:hypothetical protein